MFRLTKQQLEQRDVRRASVIPNGQFNVKFLKSYQPTIFDDMRYVYRELGGGRKLTVRISDVSVLLNQKRISKSFDSEQIRSWFDAINSSMSSSHSIDTSKFTDQDLISMCKSRRISNFSDLYDYSQKMIELGQRFEDDISKEQELAEQKRMVKESKVHWLKALLNIKD